MVGTLMTVELGEAGAVGSATGTGCSAVGSEAIAEQKSSAEQVATSNTSC